MPGNSIPTLPLDACKALSNTGRAEWRTIDGLEKVEAFGGVLGRFTRWQLPDTEPDILTTPDDCRVMGWDVHSLADAFIDKPPPRVESLTAPEQTAAPVVTASDGAAPAVPNWKMRIQAEATELFLRLLASGANPTTHSLVKPMVKWCRDNEIKTDGNINPSEGYIRTHVLGGGHWTPPTMNREQAKKHVAQVAQTKVAQVAQ